MNFARVLFFACGAFGSWAAFASNEDAAMQLEAGITRESLDNGYSGWSSQYVEAEKKLAQREALYAMLRKTERFNRQDDEIAASYTRPLNAQWSFLAEGTGSSTHLILPKYAALGQLQYAFGDGWGVHAGLRHTEYEASSVNLGMFTAERYVGDYRFAYTLYAAYPAAAGASSSQRAQVNRYYAGKSWAGLALSGGQELENLGGGQVQKSDVQSVVFNGRHWLDTNWALSYEMLVHQQGAFYTRQGIRLGLRRQF